MITERTLRKWRKEALELRRDINDVPESSPILSLVNEVLRMTQELLDQHLLRREK